MHCASCEVLLERRLKKVPGVVMVKVDRAHNAATITYTREPSWKALRDAINRDGYSLSDSKPLSPLRLAKRDYLEIGAIVLLFITLYVVLGRFDLLPSIDIADGMSLGLVFVIGLLAAMSTCLAVTGGLLLAIATKHSELHPGQSGVKKFIPTIYFTFGRLVGYAVFGALLGALGGLIGFSTTASGVLTLLAAAVMIVLGLQMLHLIPALDRVKVKMPKQIAHRLYDASGKGYRPWAPFVLGAGTFFLPCGFTQALQFSVLATGSALTGAATMVVFALGTVPMLLLVGAVSSFSEGAFRRHFVRAAAVLVIMLGFLSITAAVRLISLG